MKILILDDQRSARRVLAQILAGIEDVETVEATSLHEARAVIGRERCDVAFIDLRLADDTRNRDGLVFIRELREKTTTIPIVVSAYSEMAEIRAAMRFGAYDYVLKDDLCEELVQPVIRELRQRGELESEVLRLRARCSYEQMPGNLVGGAACMDRLRQAIRRTALSDRPALVMGPSGSGKELVVRALHGLGPHPDEPFIDLNCSAIPEPLVESQLFGHERGAFTGAERRADGYLAAVGRGTLFLDEIAELPPPLQAKLLRVIEVGRYRPLGAVAERRFTGRIVAATHVDLEARVREGRFREDLYYRLSVLVLRVPPLSERREDIPALVNHFARQQERPLQLTAEAIALLVAADWPGNVRQLRNLVDRIAVFAPDDTITAATIAELWDAPSAGPASETLTEIARAILRLPTANKLAAIEQALVQEALSMSGGRKTGAARLLGVHRKAIERRLAREEDDPDGSPP